MASAYFSINPTTGQGNTQVAVSVNSTNGDQTNRLATVSLTNGVNSKSVGLKQTYCPYFQQFASTHFSATGGSIYFTIHSEYDVVFRSVPDWITISYEGTTYAEGQRISSGAVDGKTFTLTADPNTGDARSVGATMNMGHYIGNVLQNRVTYFNFSQDAGDSMITISPSGYTATTQAGSVTYTYSAKSVSSITVSVSSNWATATTNGNVITVTYGANTSAQDRLVTITVQGTGTVGTVRATAILKQSGIGAIDAMPDTLVYDYNATSGKYFQVVTNDAWTSSITDNS